MSNVVFENDLGVTPSRGLPEHPGKFHKTGNVVSFFREQEKDYSALGLAASPGMTISFNDPVNKALQLASQYNFFELCEPILWGSEDRNYFGEMLRGIVISFKPENPMQLFLLRSIVEAMWLLIRATKFKKGVYEHNSNIKGNYGMPLGTEMAFDKSSLTRELNKQLDDAMNLYKKAKTL